MPALFAKRHYEFLAEFCALEQRMAAGFQGSMLAHMEATTEHLISRLREDNPNFKPDRFRAKIAKLRNEGGRASYRGALTVAAPRS